MPAERHGTLRHTDNPVCCLVRVAPTRGDSDSMAPLAEAFVCAAHGLAAWQAEWVKPRIECVDRMAALTS
ncbi:hypothetical protein GCM10029964_089750 [Kibdelosporangium lantanae]